MSNETSDIRTARLSAWDDNSGTSYISYNHTTGTISAGAEYDGTTISSSGLDELGATLKTLGITWEHIKQLYQSDYDKDTDNAKLCQQIDDIFEFAKLEKVMHDELDRLKRNAQRKDGAK